MTTTTATTSCTHVSVGESTEVTYLPKKSSPDLKK